MFRSPQQQKTETETSISDSIDLRRQYIDPQSHKRMLPCTLTGNLTHPLAAVADEDMCLHFYTDIVLSLTRVFGLCHVRTAAAGHCTGHSLPVHEESLKEELTKLTWNYVLKQKLPPKKVSNAT